MPLMSQEEFLRRVRDGLKALPDDDRTITPSRNHRRNAPEVSLADHTTIVEMFIARLKHHGAHVDRVAEPKIPEAVHDALRAHGAKSVVAPHGLPEEWLEDWSGTDGHHLVTDHPQLSAADLDEVDAVVTTCAGAVADAGAVVLDGGPGQGRRDPTLVPSCHICVVRVEQIDSSLPEVLDKLDSRRPITWCGGPSAPSDTKIAPVQGKHRLRQLIVLIVES
jgi:L-lactate dehydrogenase complex protein LldG